MKTRTKFLAAALFLAGVDRSLADVRYVDVNSTNATPPYTNWATAATDIQDAVDAAVAGDEIVVTNGTYASVDVGKPLNVRSVNGPEATIISGGGASICAHLIDSVSLTGFTLTDGQGYAVAGGAYRGTLNNCTLVSNRVYTASGDAAHGGGAAYCTLNNCTLAHNTALNQQLNFGAIGGGAYDCTLNNCTLTGNSVSIGGGPADASGAAGCTLNNCIVYFNTNTYGGNYAFCTLNYCCTTPQPGVGFGNVTNAPLFVNLASRNLRLQPASPCINAGNNSYVTNATDLEGNPRISGGTVDIGAYEYQWPQLTITPSGIPPSGIVLSWPTNNAGYDYTGFTLQAATNLVSPVVWTTNSPAPVVGGGQNVVTNPIACAQQFYRLKQ